MHIEQKPEVLAPSGTLESVEAVLAAGADAVYLGGKKFNMRQHRTSYNLGEAELVEAIQMAHQQNKKIYYTLNNLIFESQLSEVREVLSMLGELKPDAIIVQDLAVAAMAREICVHIPLHASTMMNLHSVEGAMALRLMGFTRAITSRDIGIHEVRQIGEASGLEMEYFVHGDLCIAQSGQCHMSAEIFNASAQQGACMKPCRWEWEVIAQKGNVKLDGISQGYVLARKDMSMLEYIPELVQAGIVSLKIEGRMRSAEFLTPIVRAYRHVVDAYFEDPYHFALKAHTQRSMQHHRVRDFTTSHAFSNPGADSIDAGGTREPRLFSISSPEPELTTDLEPAPVLRRGDFDLIVRVATLEQATAAAEAGANAIYLVGDDMVLHPSRIDAIKVNDLLEDMVSRDIRLALFSGRVTDERDLAEWQWWLKNFRQQRNLAFGISNLGVLELTRKMMRGHGEIIADYSMNGCNHIAIDEMSTMGVSRVTASVELDFEELTLFIAKSRLPVEVIGQGPLPAMLLEHCVVAAAAGETPQTCGMPCRSDRYSLRDKSNMDYRLECDRRCRNHLYTASDLCLLPNLSHLIATGAAAFQIEARFETPEAVTLLTRAYRQTINALMDGEAFDTNQSLETLRSALNRTFSDGPMAFEKPAMVLQG